MKWICGSFISLWASLGVFAAHESGRGVELRLLHETGLVFRAELYNRSGESLRFVSPMNEDPAAAGALTVVLQDASGARTRLMYRGPEEAKSAVRHRKSLLPEVKVLAPGEKAEFMVDLMDGNWVWPSLRPVGKEVSVYAEYDYPAAPQPYAWSGHLESTFIRLPISRLLEWHVLDAANRQHWYHACLRYMQAADASPMEHIETARHESEEAVSAVLREIAGWDDEQVRRACVQRLASCALKSGYGHAMWSEMVQPAEVGYADGAPEALPFEQAVRYAMCCMAAYPDRREEWGAELDRLFHMKGVEHWTPERALHVAQEVLMWQGALRVGDEEKIASFLRRLPKLAEARALYGGGSGSGSRALLMEWALVCDAPCIFEALRSIGISPDSSAPLQEVAANIPAPYSSEQLRQLYAVMHINSEYRPDIQTLSRIWPRYRIKIGE